ncbi:hypothetical protein [Lachnoclostridium sp. Marseille-P6806]|uniref:hypothetical protein n=1 Tax=Lachnoclostridium sp. Marseille-P6806 TaxID=2364793 RepID=UPI002ECFFA23
MKYLCNPMNLPYRYQIFERKGRCFASREAADPSLIEFRGELLFIPLYDGRLLHQRGSQRLGISQAAGGNTGL